MTKADFGGEGDRPGHILTRRDGWGDCRNHLRDPVTGALQSGDKIEIRGFGSFRIRQSANPALATLRLALASMFPPRKSLLQTFKGITRTW